MESGTEPKRRVTIMQLLRPHRKALSVGLLAIAGESVADLLTPWPLKIVLDNVLGQTHKKSHGWLDAVIQRTAGTGVMHILEFACVAALAIAVLDAICTYGDKYVTTSVGQWVTHDLRSRLYAQVQRLSLTYHDQNQTGDLISRVTTDIDAVQTFIVSGMLTMLVDIVTVFGMIGIMFYLSWRLTLIALVVVPPLFAIVYTYTRKVKKASRDVRKHESKLLSVVQEVLGSIRVVKAFAREEYEIQRLEGESLETVEASLKARALKARLVPIVTVVTGIGTCAVLYFGGRSAIEYGLTGGSIYLFITYIRSMYKPMQDISKAATARPMSATSAFRKCFAMRTKCAMHPAHATFRRLRDRSASSTSTSGTPKTSLCSRTSTLRSSLARRSHWSAPPARAKRPSSTSSRGSTTRSTVS